MLMMMENSGVDVHQVDLDFELHARSRSCTWPEDFHAGEEASRGSLVARKGGAPAEITQPACAPACPRKAKSSRRNAWGNLSYADLITRAIESAPERRLTLAQIYDWMVRFVPYFKDKGDSNSSAGWKNSIRHNLSLHSRFIRVQNEGTGKSSWWMLNPEGGKMGKGPRRRAASMENGTRCLKTKGRISRKKVGMLARGEGQALQGSPEHGSPAGKAGGDEYDSWTELHSRTSSSASTLSSCLSPILAEADEPEDSSPRLYPSPSSTRSPALGSGTHCPNVELPHLTDLTGAISLDEGGFPRSPQIKCNGFPYAAGAKTEASYCGPVYGQSAMSILRHHTPMETIQENKPVSFLRGYSDSNALQSLLTGATSYCSKNPGLGQDFTGNSVHSQKAPHHNQETPHHSPSIHDQNTSHHQKHQTGLDYAHSSKVNSNDHNPRQNHMHSHTTHNAMHSGPHHQALSPRVSTDILKTSNHFGPRPHLPTPPSLPPNPAGILDVPQDPCRLALAPHPRHQAYPGTHHQAVANSWHSFYHTNEQQGNGGYQGQQHGSHSRMAAPMENIPSSVDCDLNSMLLTDFIQTENMDYSFDGSLCQGVGMGLSLGAFACPPPTHSNQSWVPG